MEFRRVGSSEGNKAVQTVTLPTARWGQHALPTELVLVWEGGDLEHALDRQARSFDEFGAEFDRRGAVGHAVVELLQGVHLHEAAFVATAVFGRSRDEDFVR